MTEQIVEPAGYARSQHRPLAAAAPAEATAASLLALFLVALLVPVKFDIGSLTLTPVRVLLLVAFVPLVIRWLSGAAGRITVADTFILLHCVWIALAIIANNGTERIPYIGITVIEILGSYLLGRILIRSITDYRIFFRYFMISLAFLAPFALLEMQTARLLLSEIFEPIAATHRKVQGTYEEQRMGFFRAQVVLEHPILFGVFCSIAIANVFYIYREHLAKSLALTGFAIAMTFTSLSSGPLLAAALQIGMIGWGWVTRNAWWALAGLMLFAYVVVDVLSNRSPIQVLISYLTFNAHNAYWRLHIWNYASAEVMRNPLFGIGIGSDWTRPDWMGTASVDNFWLVTAMRYGIPGFALLVAGILASLIQIMRQTLAEDAAALRPGHVIAAIGLLVTLCTVHIWGATGSLVMFYFGAGSWFYTGTATAAAGRAPELRRGAPATLTEAPASPAAGGHRGGPTRAERLARRRAQYSGSRP